MMSLMSAEKIKIGLFTDAFFPMTDGVGMVVNNYAKRLIKYADVYVFAPLYSEEFDDNKLLKWVSFKLLLF